MNPLWDPPFVLPGDLVKLQSTLVAWREPRYYMPFDAVKQGSTLLVIGRCHTFYLVVAPGLPLAWLPLTEANIEWRLSAEGEMRL